eukprot:TRINITY_DN4554_c0_g1_i13.p1 TRINITY_DN4554_c0_g1~~TRINITY_DN4554_c0_g1_i13.p1  ORF type:complete len:282 (+),score=23.21 TRINITY_DN4554_c0_g1_i13:94-846(+)
MVMFIFAGCGSASIFSAPPGFKYSLETHQLSSFGVMVPLVFGTATMALVYTIGPSGAGHLNPAVTLALMIAKKESILQGLLMIFAQFLGSLVGVGFLAGTIPFSGDSSYGANVLGENVTPGNAFMGEMMMTMFLVHVILATTEEKKGRVLAPIVIGFTVFLGHGILLPLDGCSLNPARSFGPAVVTGKFQHFEVFLFGPVLGAIFAVPMHALMKSHTQQQQQCAELQEMDELQSQNKQHHANGQPNVAVV